MVGDVPDWALLLEAAKELGTPAPEVDKLPIWWRNVALAKISVERGVERELHKRAMTRAKARSRH